MNCPICPSVDLTTKGARYDDRYGYPGLFELFKCKHCGHTFLNQHFSPTELGKLYSEYYPRSKFTLESHKPYRPVYGIYAWLDGEMSSPFRWVPEKVTVLDIGCGFGESLGYHQSRGCLAYGVEADENIRRVAEHFGYNVHVGLFDPNVYVEGFFDYVTMSQVIEHVVAPDVVLRGIAKVLKPNGIAILSTPNPDGIFSKFFGKYWINWHTPYHLHFFTMSSMQIALKESGLILESVRSITPSAWLHYQWMHLITFPAPGRKSIFWMPQTQTLTGQSRLLFRILYILHRLKINHVITRIADAFGVGDNRLYFLRKK